MKPRGVGDLLPLCESTGMPSLHSEPLHSMERTDATPGTSSEADTEDSFRRDTVKDSPMVSGLGWFFSPQWSPRPKARRESFGGGMRREQVEAWLDDHSDFTRNYFLRRTSATSGQTEMAPALSKFPRSSSDQSELGKKTTRRRGSSPLSRSHLNISSAADRLAPFALNLTAPEWPERFSPDVLKSHSPCSPRSTHSSRFSFSPCRPLSPICPSSPDFPSSPNPIKPKVTKTPACAQGEGCPWMVGLLGGGLNCVGSVVELCQAAVVHTGGLLGAEGASLALVRKDCSGRRSLEEVMVLTALGGVSEENSHYSQAHQELVKGLMGCVLATGFPVNLRDASEDPRFNLDNEQSSKISAVLCVPIKNHWREVVGVVVLINKINSYDGSVFTNGDEKVMFNHMDVLGMILDNIQLYEGSRQEAKRSQALLEMAQVLSKEHRSFGGLLSKMAATIMPFTHAQYCTIFIPNNQTLPTQDKVSFSRIIHLECEELGSSCQIYRRERDVTDVDPTYALQTLMNVKTLNVSQLADDSRISVVCCPVRNEQSENVIAVCQLLNKRNVVSGELEAFNRYDERLLEDLAVYCGLALQYVQAVQITEERKASIEVTREVLAYHISATEQEIEALQEATIPSAESLHLFDFHFSDFGLQEDVTTQAAVRMFLDLHLVQDFNIDYKSLCQWVLTVRRGYRNNVPYHNWNHALSTAQSMFAMLMATEQLQNVFTRLEILALMISTLSHDLDHRGVNNSYIERTQQPLAQLYGHSSLENHHYNLCVFILNNTGSPILSGLSAEQHRTVLHMIKRAILATDLSVYMQRRKDFLSLVKKKRVNWKSETQRDLLRSMLMTASDLSAVTKPWPEQKRITKLVAMEFFAQGDKEKEEFKIKPIDIMNRENSTRFPVMQVEYIDEICYPLYKTISKMFSPCTPLLSGCKKNREKWLRLAKEAEDDDSDHSSCATLEQHKSNEDGN